MRRPPTRRLILAASAATILLAGLVWTLTIGKRDSKVPTQRLVADALSPGELKKRLEGYRKQIDELAREEYWALTAADNDARAIAGNRKRAEYVWQYGVPAPFEYYAEHMQRAAKAAAASRGQAVSLARKRRELEEAYYRLWESVPPDLWESIRVAPSGLP
jgi:hypothetical protein